MNFRNISQETYDRIVSQTRDTADSWRPRVRGQDARDLLEAYEGAMVLLDRLYARADYDDQVDDFLYLPHYSGRPKLHRVVLDDGEPLTYSARGELRPAEVDSEDY